MIERSISTAKAEGGAGLNIEAMLRHGDISAFYCAHYEWARHRLLPYPPCLQSLPPPILLLSRPLWGALVG